MYWLRLPVCAAARKRPATNVQCRVAHVMSSTGQSSQKVPKRSADMVEHGPAPQTIIPGSWLRVYLLVYYIQHQGTRTVTARRHRLPIHHRTIPDRPG